MGSLHFPMGESKKVSELVFSRLEIYRDVNGIIKNSLKMPGSRGNALVRGWEKLNFHTSTA